METKIQSTIGSYHLLVHIHNQGSRHQEVVCSEEQSLLRRQEYLERINILQNYKLITLIFLANLPQLKPIQCSESIPWHRRLLTTLITPNVTFFLCSKSVLISLTTPETEMFAPICFRVESPGWYVSFTWTRFKRKFTSILY